MIIVTGGTGYIGKNIAFYLLSQGENVLLVDDYSRSSRFKSTTGYLKT